MAQRTFAIEALCFIPADVEWPGSARQDHSPARGAGFGGHDSICEIRPKSEGAWRHHPIDGASGHGGPACRMSWRGQNSEPWRPTTELRLLHQLIELASHLRH